MSFYDNQAEETEFHMDLNSIGNISSHLTNKVENNILQDQSKLKTGIKENDNYPNNEESKKSNNSQTINCIQNKTEDEDKVEKKDNGVIYDNTFDKKLDQSLEYNNLSTEKIKLSTKNIFIRINNIKRNCIENGMNNPFFWRKKIEENLIKYKRLKEKLGSNELKAINDSISNKINLQKGNKNLEDKKIEKSGKLVDQQKYSIEATIFTSEEYYNEIFIKTICCSLKNICMFINERIILKYKINFNFDYMKTTYEIDIFNYEEYLEHTILDFYLGEYLKINKEEKEKIKYWIYSLINSKDVKEKDKIKLLDKLLHKKLREIYLLYIDNYPFLKENVTEFYLNGFKTFNYDFKEIDEKFKIILNKYFHSIIDNNKSNIDIEKINEQNKIETNSINENIYYLQDNKSKKENNLIIFSLLNNNISKISFEQNKKPLSYVGKKRKKEKESNDYAIRRKIMVEALNNIHSIMEELCMVYTKKKLHTIYLTQLIKHNITQYLEVINSQLYDIYKKSFPKNVSKDIKKDNSKNKHNLDILNDAIKEEEKQGKKKLYILVYKVTFKDILLAFVNDEQVIIIKDENGEEFKINLKGFKTLKDFPEQKNYSKEQLKLIIIRLINGEIKTRKSRKSI